MSSTTDDHPLKIPSPTEDRVAAVLAERDRGRLRYCHDAAAWFLWDGALWRRDRTGAVLQKIRELAREVGTCGEETAAGVGTIRFVGAVEKFARSDPAFAVTGEIWDRDAAVLGTPAGPVDLKTGAARPADPADNISRTTAVAPAESADCPTWRRFLDETFGDPAIMTFVQRFFGYALTGATGEQVLLFGHGRGGNGKSVFLRTIAGVMGDYARPAPLTTLTGPAGGMADLARPNSATASGARLVTIAEASKDRVWTEARLKLLTGGDAVAGRKADAALPICKLFVTGNQLPPLAALDQAMHRRIVILPFARKPAVPDKDLDAKLRYEWPDILRWLIDGARDWFAHGLPRPEAVSEATGIYFQGQDIVAHFLADACDCQSTDASRTASAGALFAAWTAYAKALGERPGSPRTFAESLQERGFTRDRTNAGRIFRGLRLTAATDADAEAA